MRILHISALPVWPMGGGGGMPSLRETLRGHVRWGYDVTVVLPQYTVLGDRREPIRVPQGDECDVFFAPCGWLPPLKALRRWLKQTTGSQELPYPVRWLLNMATMLLLTASLLALAMRLRYRQRREFDLVYAHNQYAALAGFLLGAAWRIPNVTRLYGTFLADLMERPLVWLRYPVAAAGYLVPHSLLICGNDGTRGDEVARRLGIDLSRFRFWQNGVDRPQVDPSWTREAFAAGGPPNLRPDAKWIVSCSRLSYWKRLDRVLRAFRHCWEACPDAQLLVAGDGPERERLQALARDLGVAEEVVWLGSVAHAEVWQLMHLADVFVIANDVTNRCNPVYEAIRAGLPIVSIRDHSTEDLLTDGTNALLADADDEAGLGRCLARACTETGLAARMRAAQEGRSASLWTWQERMKAETEELERLVEERPRGGRRRQGRRGALRPGAGPERVKSVMSIRRWACALAGRLYYGLWPRLRPGGYQGRLATAHRRREGADWTAPEEVRRQQTEKLNALLEHAVQHVPYYRRLVQKGRVPFPLERLEDLAAWPVLTKDIIRAEGDGMLAENYPRDQVRPLATGGSSGEPLHFWSDYDALLCKNAAESWASAMAGLRRGSSVAMLWGAGRFEPSSRQDLREGLQRLITNRLFIDCFKMDEQDLEVAHGRLTRFRPDGLLGYASALVELARYLQHRGFRPVYPRAAIISAAETLDEVSREVLETTFPAPVFNRYGSREMGLIAVECDRHEGLHVDAENVVVELGDGPEGTGLRRILVTKLTQYSMPFIRYDIGDFAEGPLAWCSCGRGYPVLKKVVGRVTEVIRKPEGGCLPGELFPHLFKDCGIASYRVEQAADYTVDVALVRTSEQTEAQDAELRRVMARYLGGSVPVAVRYVDRIERSPTGKLLPVVSHVRARPGRSGNASY